MFLFALFDERIEILKALEMDCRATAPAYRLPKPLGVTGLLILCMMIFRTLLMPPKVGCVKKPLITAFIKASCVQRAKQSKTQKYCNGLIQTLLGLSPLLTSVSGQNQIRSLTTTQAANLY